MTNQRAAALITGLSSHIHTCQYLYSPQKPTFRQSPSVSAGTDPGALWVYCKRDTQWANGRTAGLQTLKWSADVRTWSDSSGVHRQSDTSKPCQHIYLIIAMTYGSIKDVSNALIYHPDIADSHDHYQPISNKDDIHRCLSEVSHQFCVGTFMSY